MVNVAASAVAGSQSFIAVSAEVSPNKMQNFAFGCKQEAESRKRLGACRPGEGDPGGSAVDAAADARAENGYAIQFHRGNMHVAIRDATEFRTQRSDAEPGPCTAIPVFGPGRSECCVCS